MVSVQHITRQAAQGVIAFSHCASGASPQAPTKALCGADIAVLLGLFPGDPV